MIGELEKTKVEKGQQKSGSMLYASASAVADYLRNGGTMYRNLEIDFEHNKFRKVA